MNVSDWIQVLLFGGLVGAVGQAIRLIGTIKKMGYGIEAGQKLIEVLDVTRVVLGLLIGFVAGVIGVLSLGLGPKAVIDAQTVVTLLGIGYAGADFIEAFMQKVLPPNIKVEAKADVKPDSKTNQSQADTPMAVG